MKKLLCILLVFTTILGTSGCIPGSKSERISKNSTFQPIAEKKITDSFTDAQMNFSVELLKGAANQHSGENILVSPLSAMLALSMTANGADGNTKTEMEQVLGGTLSLEEINEELYTYTQKLPSDKKYQLHLANSIWIKDDPNFSIEKDFLNTNALYYDAEIYKTAFNMHTVQDINRWVKKNTDGMIDKIVNEFPEDALMYLINALSFEAEWARIYEKDQIRKTDFTSYTGERETLEMMFSSEYLYLEDEKATGFLKDYKDGKYRFVALLPNEDVDIYEYIRQLDYQTLLQMLQNPSAESVYAAIPKFKYDFSIKLNDTLETLGMKSAFYVDSANFTKLGSYPEKNIYISEVLQKTFITVDEKGTKAGAVTSVALCKGEGAVRPKEVLLTRPFIYMIIDSEHNLPIFIGAVLER